jgi:hypothetical protein
VSSPARHPATWPGTNLTRSPARKYDRALARPENWMIGAPSRDDSVSPAPLGLRPSGPGHSGPPPSWLASRFPPWSRRSRASVVRRRPDATHWQYRGSRLEHRQSQGVTGGPSALGAAEGARSGLSGVTYRAPMWESSPVRVLRDGLSPASPPT